MSGAKVYSQSCCNRRRNLPNVSQGSAEHRTSTNHFVLALGHSTDSNDRHQTSGLPTARYEKSLFGHDLARLNGDTKPKLTSPSSSKIRTGRTRSDHRRVFHVTCGVRENHEFGRSRDLVFKITAIDHSAIPPHVT